MGIVDSVYSPIYPLGSVVELDWSCYQRKLQKSLAEGARTTRYDFRPQRCLFKEGFDDYVVDYLARIWPLGEMPGMDAFFR